MQKPPALKPRESHLRADLALKESVGSRSQGSTLTRTLGDFTTCLCTMRKGKLFHVGLPTLPSKGSLELMTSGANRLLLGGHSPQVFPKADRITQSIH